jgi:hypothetical protein
MVKLQQHRAVSGETDALENRRGTKHILKDFLQGRYSPSMVDKAKCPHCDSWIKGDDIGTLDATGSSVSGYSWAGLRVCPSCDTILG